MTESARLRIAIVAPPYFSLPPQGYGGVEAVAADLVDALIERGHHVTLVGAGEQATRATEFIQTFGRTLRELGLPEAELAHAALAARSLENVDADVIHDHTLAGPLLARGRLQPTVATVHGPVDGIAAEYYRSLDGSSALVAISDAQRSSAADLPWLRTVHNGVRADSYPFRSRKDDFAIFLGRFHPTKAPHLAIDAARAGGLRIILAGKCSEPAETDYFDREVRPRLGPDATVIGVADAKVKRDLLSRAACLLFPICWNEPFGLVMVEAMACGTPVVALRRGSVPEVVLHGKTGYVVDDPDELPKAIRQAVTLDARACRRHVMANFTTAAMAAGYEAAYAATLAHRCGGRSPRTQGVNGGIGRTTPTVSAER
jgi:glycosyltransferase involved in cell wall biosynthesis